VWEGIAKEFYLKSGCRLDIEKKNAAKSWER
jgi:hypothetical protein